MITAGFREVGAEVGQVLVTRHDVGHRQQYVNACQTLERLLELGVFVIGFGYPVVPEGHARLRAFHRPANRFECRW